MNTLNKLKKSTQPIILRLINQVIKTGTFPQNLKISRIIPILKNGQNEKLDPSSYRPVNLLSPISKLIGKVWTMQINKFLSKNEIIDNNNQGSIKGRSGAIILHELYHNLSMIKKENETGALVSLDQSAAYDIIPHQILKSKLDHKGM